jgi:hypothetical protein
MARANERIRVYVAPIHDDSVHDALQAIDAVHTVPNSMPTIPVESDFSIVEEAQYCRYPITLEPARIVLGGTEQPALDFCHEFGHFVDQCGLAGRRRDLLTATEENWATLHPEVRESMEGWWRAVRGSEAYGIVRDLRANPVVEIRGVLCDFRVLVPLWENLLRPGELWARSYAQYIALRSGNGRMRGELDELLGLQRNEVLCVPEQWTNDDFVPIMEALDRLFGVLGWLRKAQ